jgi:putative membrane protein
MRRLSFTVVTACLATAALVQTTMAQTPGGTPRTDVPNPANPPPISNTDTSRTPAAGSTATSGATDEQFIKKMANGGMMEVEAGKLASSRASNPQVKQFGQMMVKDHSKSNEKLKALAETRKVDLPKSPDGEKKAQKEKLEAHSGAAFDAAYMDTMVTAHQQTVALLEDQIKNGKDATVRHYAQETLPTVRSHLEQAQQLQAQVSQRGDSRTGRSSMDGSTNRSTRDGTSTGGSPSGSSSGSGTSGSSGSMSGGSTSGGSTSGGSTTGSTSGSMDRSSTDRSTTGSSTSR